MLLFNLRLSTSFGRIGVSAAGVVNFSNIPSFDQQPSIVTPKSIILRPNNF